MTNKWEDFRSFTQSILTDIQRMVSKAMSEWAMEKLGLNKGGSIFGGSGGFGFTQFSAPSAGSGGGIGMPLWGTPGFGFFASGGIVTRPQLAMIGEVGPEAVIPLGRLRDPAFLDALMSGRSGGGDRGGGSGNGNVVFNVQTPGPAAFKHTSAQLMAQAAVALGRRRRA
jgi:phage-related minor tail protein